MKVSWKPGTMIYPLPAVIVTCGTMEHSNMLTVAWTGTLCTNPPMCYISVRPERHSYSILKKNMEFVINLTTEELTYATDYCGVKSGRDVDKWKEAKLTPVKADKVQAPLVAESPVNLECRVTRRIPLGTHDMFLAEVVAVHADEAYMDEKEKFSLAKANPMVYSHGTYYGLGKELGTFGYSVRKK